MKIKLVIIHLDMVVDSLELEPREYSVGRSQDNNIVIQHFSLKRTQGKVFFNQGKWFYQSIDDRQPTEFRDDQVTMVSDQIGLAPEVYLENEKVSIQSLSELQQSRSHLLKQRKIMTLAALLLFLILPVAIFFINWSLKAKNDPNRLLSQVRHQIVEFESVMNRDTIEEYKKIAGMTDSEFKESLGFCTGFLVSSNVVLTASHCLFGSMVIDINKNFFLKTHDGKKHTIKRVLGFDIQRDFLFLETEGMESYGSLNFAKSHQVGQKVFTVGNVHGEGIAIRDGIMASETRDPNDPDVKFIRYSAGTSPGNSGGPLLDKEGDIVALVFASTSTENYNLGTPSEDLRKGFEKFVTDREPKTLKITLKKLLNFNVSSVLQALSIPYLPQFLEYPETAKVFNEMEVELEAPLSMDVIDEIVLNKFNDTALENYFAVEKLLKEKGEQTLDWKSFVTKETPVILPSQFDFSQNVFIKKNDRYIMKTSGFIDSPSKADMGKYKEQLKTEGKFDFQAYGYNIYYSDKNIDVPDDSLFFKPKDVSGRKIRLFDISRGIPYSQLLLDVGTKPSETPSVLSMELFLKNVLGEDGVLFNTASQYSRPKSVRDFTIHQLNPEVEVSDVLDQNGRLWKRSYFKFLELNHIYIYCHDLPEGSLCLSRIMRMQNSHLLKIVETNFRKFVLTHLIINPFFWKTDKLMSFLEGPHLKGMKSLESIQFLKKSAGTWLDLKAFPIRLKLPNFQTIESIRGQTGLFGSSSGVEWTGYGVEWIQRGQKGDKVCGAGVEPYESKATFILNYLRDRRKQEKLKKIKGDDPDPLPGIWYKAFRGLENPFQVYGYCAPLVEDPRVENQYFADFRKARRLKIDYLLN